MHALSSLTGRTRRLFDGDIARCAREINDEVRESAFLVTGGAGTIGQAVVKELFARNPRRLDVVDLSENNLTELVRDLRCSMGYTTRTFRTFAVDVGGLEFDALVSNEGPYDYVLNLSALKHVRSEKDPYTLMRMLCVNILNALKLSSVASRRYFSVSTDKAARPANLMGATKRLMEVALDERGGASSVSGARLPNIAFSDGSLLYGFTQRIQKQQPLAAPRNIRRYFISAGEAGGLCLMSAILAGDRERFFPKLDPDEDLYSITELAERFLRHLGYTPLPCSTEDEARAICRHGVTGGEWPCYFPDGDTTGEKPVEELCAPGEPVDLERFDDVGVILGAREAAGRDVRSLVEDIERLRAQGSWSSNDILDLVNQALPEFEHHHTGRYLDGRM